MGQNYLTKYRCRDYMYDIILDNEEEAEIHCTGSYPEEIYICEVCGYETYDNTDAVTECELHS